MNDYRMNWMLPAQPLGPAIKRPGKQVLTPDSTKGDWRVITEKPDDIDAALAPKPDMGKWIKHDGGELLSEHVGRAVLVRAQNSVVLSSQRSPGPIEAARCLIAGAALVSRPPSTGRVAFGISA